MEKLTRIEQPSWLADSWKQWGKDWKVKHKMHGSAAFTWRVGEAKKQELVDALLEQNQHHCAFCDVFELEAEIRETIEHFRPKAKHHYIAYYWPNLFICCDKCQAKGDEFEKALLKPDVDSYDFSYYFEIDWSTGKLKPNEERNELDQYRAEITIELYDLNRKGLPKARKRALKSFKNEPTPDIDEFSYRFFIKSSADYYSRFR